MALSLKQGMDHHLRRSETGDDDAILHAATDNPAIVWRDGKMSSAGIHSETRDLSILALAQ